MKTIFTLLITIFITSQLYSQHRFMIINQTECDLYVSYFWTWNEATSNNYPRIRHEVPTSFTVYSWQHLILENTNSDNRFPYADTSPSGQNFSQWRVVTGGTPSVVYMNSAPLFNHMSYPFNQRVAHIKILSSCGGGGELHNLELIPSGNWSLINLPNNVNMIFSTSVDEETGEVEDYIEAWQTP